MKALILTCNTGEGHNSVAAAVREVFFHRGTPCDVTDALAFLSERAAELIAKGHTQMYRHAPGAWRLGYKFMENHPAATDEESLIVQFLSSGAERLHELVRAKGYDCLICPHVFSALMVTRMRRLWPQERLRTCFIATDHTCSPMVDDCQMDMNFVPSEDAAAEFLAAGIPAEGVMLTPGIPVRQAFYEHTEKAEARAFFGLPRTGRLVLVMGGSMGCGPLEELTERLDRDMDPGDSIAVVCGTNAHLQKRMERQFAGRERVHVMGWCADMSRLMDASDLYLTKPGGVGTAEAAVKSLPMVLVDAVAACEDSNLRLFCKRGGAVTAEKTGELAGLCLRLLDDEAARARMGAAMHQPGNAGERIYGALTEAAG